MPHGLRGIDALIAGHEHINLNEKVTGADGKTIHVVEAGSAFAEVGLLSIPYKYDTNGTETTDDDTVTVPADGSDEKLYTAKNVNDLLADPDKGSDYQSCLEAVRNKIKPLDEAFENESNKVLGTSTTNYFYGEDAAGTHGWEMVRTTDFRPSKEGDTTKAQTIGHVICSSYLDLTGADLAIENAGGIRGGIAAGNVTAGNVIAISPYGNTVETWTMTGADFLAALEHSLQISDDCNDSYELQQAYVAAGHTEQEAQDKYKWRDDSGSVLSFGGINVTIDWTQPEGKRIVECHTHQRRQHARPRQDLYRRHQQLHHYQHDRFSHLCTRHQVHRVGHVRGGAEGTDWAERLGEQDGRARRHHQLWLRCRGPHAHTGPDA